MEARRVPTEDFIFSVPGEVFLKMNPNIAVKIAVLLCVIALIEAVPEVR